MYTKIIFIFLYCFTNFSFPSTRAQTVIPAYVTRGFCVPGGDRQRELATLGSCFQQCHDTKSCLAFEFNEVENSCFFHGISTACDQKVENSNCMHFGLVQCELDSQDVAVPTPTAAPTTPTTQSTTTTTAPTTSTRAPTTAPTTTTTTVAPTTTATTAPTTTTAATTQPTTTPTTTTPQPAAQVATTSGPAETTTGPTEPTTTDPYSHLDLAGFVFTAEDMHMRGGHLLDSGIRQQECLDVCRNHPLCLAVDYVAKDGACYAHDGDTYCGILKALEGSIHHKRVPCVAGATRDAAVEIYSGMYSPGGLLLCAGDCSIESCLSACYVERDCVGLTINTTTGACYSHIDSSVCDIARVHDNVIQINIGQCFADNCLSNPCKHGGTCLEDLGGYSCRCTDGFHGEKCQLNRDDCAYHPCYNGGTCVDLTNDFYCRCPPGFVGAVCDIDIDECASHPCQNGATCKDGVDSYMCSCALGFSGVHCETNVDECSADTCDNGGTCVDGINSFRCLCGLGWGGITCSERLSTCWKEERWVKDKSDLVVTDRRTPVEQCVGFCFIKETMQQYGSPLVERGCMKFAVARNLQLGCAMEDRRRSVTCYCDTRRCNGLSIDAMTSLILHLPFDTDLFDHSGLNNHATRIPDTSAISYNCTDASTACSVQVDGSQCLSVPSLSGYIFGHPDPLDLSIFLPRLTAVVAFKKSTASVAKQGIIGTNDFAGSDEPRFQITQGYPSRDYISAGLHADEDLTTDLNDFIAQVHQDRWYLATLTYDGFHQKAASSTSRHYSQSTMLYLDGMKTRGNANVNLGNVTVSAQPVTVGCAGGNYFTGQIDEVRLFNDVLSEEDRRALLAMRD